jgi:hypothetical protein
MPARPAPSRIGLPTNFADIEKRLANLEAWVRANMGAFPAYTEATKPQAPQMGQAVLVTDASAGHRGQLWTGTEWVALG